MTFPHCPHRPLAGLAAGVVLAASGTVLPIAAMAQDAPAGQRIVTMTRGVRIFGDAETQLVAALKAHDSATLDKLVLDDFEQRSQPAPGDALTREDWLKQAAAAAAASTGWRQMAVHDLGDTAIVSFQWLHPAPDFVVDVWRKKAGTDDWQLAIRYLAAGPAAPAPAPARSVPTRKPTAAPASSPVDPKR